MAVMVRYPTGSITPHGAYHVLHDAIPQFSYTSPDGSAIFNMAGGASIPDQMAPESIRLTGLKGLIPPWQNIEQKGAQQDGATYITSLYDPIEVDLELIAKGRNSQMCRKVLRDFIESWDAKTPGELAWFTHDLGRWWAPVRWAKQPVDKLLGGAHSSQPFTWTAKAYDGFWRSYDHAEQFKFTYADAYEVFDFDTSGSGASTDLGSNWTCAYSGSGGGFISSGTHWDIFGIPIGFPQGGQAFWTDDPDHPVMTGTRDVICRRNGFTSTTDWQVVSMQLGSMPEVSYPHNGADFIWARMNTSGAPGISGVAVKMTDAAVELITVSGGVGTVQRHKPIIIPPLPGEWWTLVCGFEGNDNLVKVYRRGLEVMSAIVPTPIGVNNRGAGFGMQAGAAILTQATPGTVLTWSAADNNTQTQYGFIPRINVGDQPMFDRITCFGPGNFIIADGPGSKANVTFGALYDGQVVQIRTDPRKRSVVDLTAVPPPPQQLVFWKQALVDFINFASANNVPPLLQAIESAFGVRPPQGNLYSLLHGRFSDNAAIPPKPPGQPPIEYELAVGIEGGNANSAIIASGTPLRRYPY